MHPEAKPVPYRAEPFRLFFPLAFVLGVTGVAHWLLFSTGAIGCYPGRFHAVTRTQAFLLAFAAGFLFTAVPKRTGTPPAAWLKIGLLLALLPAVSIATLFDTEVLGQAAYAGAVIVLAQFAVRRFVPWPVVAFGALFASAMGLRATALAVPEHYFGWLGAAAALWLAGATVWALFLLPRTRHVVGR